jgi:phosphoglycolate phosphatase-like HAD superfamily hydrolase
MKIIFIDFDGTIVNVYDRYFGILEKYVDNHFSLKIDYNRYIKLKREGLKDHQIIENSSSNLNFIIDDYMKFKRLNLEDLNWLKYDKLIKDPVDFAKYAKNLGYKLVLLSQRTNVENLNSQLSFLKIKNIFDEIVVVHPNDGVNVKLQYLKHVADIHDVVIGDSISELKAANELGISSYFVDTGLYNSSFVFGNSIIVNDYTEVLNYLI